MWSVRGAPVNRGEARPCLFCTSARQHPILCFPCRNRSAGSQDGDDYNQDEPESEHTADRRKRKRPARVGHLASFCKTPTLQLILSPKSMTYLCDSLLKDKVCVLLDIASHFLGPSSCMQCNSFKSEKAQIPHIYILVFVWCKMECASLRLPISS